MDGMSGYMYVSMPATMVHAHISTWGMQFVFVDNHFKIKDMLTSDRGDEVHIVGGYNYLNGRMFWQKKAEEKMEFKKSI